jgi:hypothetical protein
MKKTLIFLIFFVCTYICCAQEIEIITTILVPKATVLEHINNGDPVMFKELNEQFDIYYKESFLESFAKAEVDLCCYAIVVKKNLSSFSDSVAQNRLYDIIKSKKKIFFNEKKTHKDTSDFFYEWLFLIDCIKDKRFISDLQYFLKDTSVVSQNPHTFTTKRKAYCITRINSAFCCNYRISYVEPKKVCEFALDAIFLLKGEKRFSEEMEKIIEQKHGETPMQFKTEIDEISKEIKVGKFDYQKIYNFFNQHHDEAFNILVQQELNKL